MFVVYGISVFCSLKWHSFSILLPFLYLQPSFFTSLPQKQENKSLSASCNHAQFLCAGMLKPNDSFVMYRLFASWKEEVFLGLASSKGSVT